jgi:hypothetical protein
MREGQTIDHCANCDSPVVYGKRHLNDDHSDANFCDSQCFREWAEDKGAEKVIAFYTRMNCGDVII